MTDYTKRPRATRDEMIARKRAELEKLLSQQAGTFKDSDENDMVKRLGKRRSKTTTALRAAQCIVHGVAKKDGTGWQRAPIVEKIAGTEKRLEEQKAALLRAQQALVDLPFDVERLTNLIAVAELGEDDVEFPTDLTRLASDADPKSDEEHEADFIAKTSETIEA